MSEIVEWIAFGRVPQMQYHFVNETDEILDYRLDWRGMPDNFYPSFEFPWFDPLEFESLGIPMVEGYLEAAEKCVYESVSDLPRLIKEYEKKIKSTSTKKMELIQNSGKKLQQITVKNC